MSTSSFQSSGLFQHIETFAPMAVWKSLALSRPFATCPEVAGSQRGTGHQVHHDQVPCLGLSSMSAANLLAIDLLYVLLGALASIRSGLGVLGVLFAIVLGEVGSSGIEVLLGMTCSLLAGGALVAVATVANVLLSGIPRAIHWRLVANAAAH